MDNIFRPELIARFNASDVPAFNEIFEGYRGRIYFFVRRIIGDDAEAEDIVLDTFRKLWQKAPDIDSEKSLRAFLYITAKNSSVDYLRANQRQTENKKQLENFLDTSEDLILNNIIVAEILGEIYKKVGGLSKRDSTIFYLFFRDNLSFREIGEQMGIPEGTARQRKFRIVEMLKKFVANRHLLPVLLAIYLLFH